MAKVTLPNISSGFASTTQLNTALDTIEAEFNNKVLYRDPPAGEPNQLEADIDANDNTLYNVRDAVDIDEVVTLGQMQRYIQASSSGLIAVHHEQQTAVEDQTLFTFTGLAYVPGINNLAVFVNGLRQRVSVNYAETSSSSITFTSQLNVGDVVDVYTNEAVTSTTLPADAVSYTPAGTGAVATNVQTKLRETVSVKDFGAAGDGVTDDTAAIQSAATACLTTGQTLFVPAGTYKITSTITISGISVICEDPRTTKFQAVGNFTAFKFLCNGKTLKNFNLWFTPPVSSAAVGYQFGEGSTQFARNNVENFAVRYASTAYYASSDMWGNVFTQMNADFPLVYGYDFTANPSGTTNSFRNLYATNAHTTGSITSGTPTLTVADATNMSAGQTWVVLGAGATGALVTTIVSVVGTTVTLAANAANTVSSVPVLSAGTAWKSVSFSDTHFYNAYFDGFPSTANGLAGAVYFSGSNVTADSIRFEGCAVISANTALIDDRANSSEIGGILSFATYIDSGAGNYGFIYRCGAASFTQHIVGDVDLGGFAQWSGGLKKLRVSATDNLTFLGKGASVSDSDDNGYEGCLFYSDIVGRVSTSTPATGSWDIGDQYFVKTPVAGGASGGVCLSSGTFGTLTSVTANTTSGSNKITLSGLSTLKRNQFITIAGVTGVFKVIDIQTGASTTALVVPAPGSTVSSAAVAYATPTFAKSGSIELTASTTWDPPSVGIGGAAATTLTVTGATVGDYAIASFDQSLQSLQLTAYVYTTNGVAVTLSNSLGGSVDLPSGTLRVRVIKQ